MADASGLYLQLIKQADMARVRRGVSLDGWSDLAGVADRYANKIVRPTARGLVGSKVPRYETLDELLEAIYGHGYKVVIVPGRPAGLSRHKQRPPEQIDLFDAA